MAFFAITSVLLAEPPRRVGEAEEHPKDGFASFEDLKHWAESSSFGGGFATSYRLGGREVYVVNRCVTSGVATTELSIYLQRPGASRLSCVLFQPVRRAELRCELKDQALVVTQYDSQKQEWIVVMTINEQFFER